MARLLRLSPPEVRKLVKGHTLQVLPQRFGDIIDAWQFFDEAGHHVLSIVGDHGKAASWSFSRGDEKIELSDNDGDGRPDERERETYESDAERLRRRVHEVWAGGRWIVRSVEDYRSCDTKGAYREETITKSGKHHVAYHSCIVS